MGYSVHTISSITEIPALWAAFASAEGWTVDTSNPNQPVITRTGYPNAMPIRLKATISGNNHDITVDSPTGEVTSASVTRSPVLNPDAVANGQYAVAPTKVHFIGRGTSEPFIATVIEYGYNLYRHIYTGYMEKCSSYEGGEVISGSNFMPIGMATSSSTVEFRSRNYISHLFEYVNPASTTLYIGGVRVIHPNNPTPFRRFYANGFTSSIDGFANASRNSTVMGGWRDCVNGGYGIVGRSNYSMGAVLSKIRLLITKDQGGVTRFQNIGNVAGIRFINIQDLEPGQQVSTGSKNFIVFPAFSKSTSTSISTASGLSTQAQRRARSETSHYLGYAYELD